MALMPNEAEASTQNLLDAHAHVWNHIFNFINSMSLKSAVQLGIPDAIHKHGKPMTLSELTNALPINKTKSHDLSRVMRMLTHSKFFEKIRIEGDQEEAYGLTGASRLLLRDAPLTMAPFTLAMLDAISVDPFQHVSEYFQDEHPSPFSTKHGKDIWEYGGAQQMWSKMFNEAMASDARFVASILVRDCKKVFEGLKTLVDVGGGTGTAAEAIADAFPGLKCTVLDLPRVVDGIEGAENLNYVSGDMFDSILHADAVFLKWIFHDWMDEKCVQLLGKCKEAIIPSKNNGAKVIIVEMVVNDQEENDKATQTQLFLDMLMMANVTGKERTEKEWADLFLAAGFTNYKITPVLGLRSVIEVFP